MKSLHQALAESGAKFNQDMTRASERAYQVYDRLSTKAVAKHEKRVDKIVAQANKMSPAAVAFARQNDVEAIRAEIRRKIGLLHHQTSHEYKTLWTEAYARIQDAVGVNPSSRVVGDEPILDVVVQMGLLGVLRNIVGCMLEDTRLYLNRPAVPTHPAPEQLPLPFGSLA